MRRWRTRSAPSARTRILPAVIGAGVALAIAVGVVAYAAGHYGEQTKTRHDRRRPGRDDGDVVSEGLARGRGRRAHVRPVRVRRLPRDAGPGRRRSGGAGADDARAEPHRRAADAHHQPRSRRVGEPEAAVHAGLGRGPLEDAGREPRRLHPRRPAAGRRHQPVSVPTGQGAAVAGAALYVRYGCINCHGPNGLGGVPNPQSPDKAIPPLSGQGFRTTSPPTRRSRTSSAAAA